MRYSFWPDGSSPIFLNPTFDEIKELAKLQPDTLRINEDEDIALASGYGCTHETVVKAARIMLNNKRWSGLDYILFRQHQEWRWNPLGHWPTRSESIRLESGYNWINPRLKECIIEFVRLYDSPLDT